MAKRIFITGTSKGFGRIWAEAALNRGDKVIATARNLSDIQDLNEKYGEAVLTLSLDVTDRNACLAAVKKAMQHFNGIDVLISNAGYGHFGCIEEINENDARSQIETNVFGSLWMIQAVLPVMRQQQSGHILQVSSIGGLLAFPMLGIYHASKWAIEGICESLNAEVQAFGIKVTLIEPGGYATDWGTNSAVHSRPIEAYHALREAMGQRSQDSANMIGNPGATAEAILKVIDDANPPLRLLLGKFVLQMIESTYMQRLETWKNWEKVSEAAQN
ncbi:oxidoreductase [Chitinophaga sp.]|uniref:oxidoreductase n=1 Tax=Chitinophaga sp. TaxID=1869181 RepID=UPI0031D9B21B